jgi:hypothetical protein
MTFYINIYNICGDTENLKRFLEDYIYIVPWGVINSVQDKIFVAGVKFDISAIKKKGGVHKKILKLYLKV